MTRKTWHCSSVRPDYPPAEYFDDDRLDHTGRPAPAVNFATTVVASDGQSSGSAAFAWTVSRFAGVDTTLPVATITGPTSAAIFPAQWRQRR